MNIECFSSETLQASKSMSKSPYCFHTFSIILLKENLVFRQNISEMISFFVLITYLLEFVVKY